MAREEFPDDVKTTVRRRSGGYCECTRKSCNHPRGCSKKATEFHHKTQGGPGTASNCEHLCDACHKATRSYGKPVG